MKIKTVKDFLNYAIGDLFVKGFLFISLPLLSHILDPIEYGKLSIINTAIMIMYVFVSLNLQNSVINRYMITREDFPSYLKSITIFLIPFQILLFVVSPFIKNAVSNIIGIESKDYYWVLGICILLSYIYIFTSFLQGARESKKYVMFNLFTKIGEILLIFLFALFLSSQQYMSKIYAQIIIGVFAFLYVLYEMRWILKGEIQFHYLKEALYFSIPLIIHVLSNSLLSQVDRLMINDMLGSYEAGIYSFAYNLGMAILVFIMAWNSAWQPRFYRLLEEKKIEQIKNSVLSATSIVFIISAALIFYSKEIVLLVASENYFNSISVLPLIILGNSLIHIYLIYVNFLFFLKKSVFISLSTLIAMSINIAVNLLLIPKFGITGSAYATIFSYFVLAILHYVSATYITKNNIFSPWYLIIFTVGLLLVYTLSIFLDKTGFITEQCVKAVMIIGMIFMCLKMKIHHRLRE